MGMLRNIMIVGAALAFMPSPPPGENGTATVSTGAFAYVAAAAETVADMRSFCQRNPNVCVTATSLAQTMEGKAKYSAKLIYEWANEATSDARTAQLPSDVALADPIQTSAPPQRRVDLQESQSTLSVADLVEPWHKPKDTAPKG